MTMPPPKYHPTDSRRGREAKEAFQAAARDLVLEAVRCGWREAEAAMALADAADEYVMFLSERPRRNLKAANSN
jgi:hypothetical protein